MNKVPENLQSLRAHEESLRKSAIKEVESSLELVGHLDLMERAMDVLDILRQRSNANDDDRAIGHLSIRVFNAFASAWMLLSSGYYQTAALILRDIVETVCLVNYFSIDRLKIEVWRKADRKQLMRDFGPASVRKALEDHAGQGKSRREEIYIKFSNIPGTNAVGLTKIGNRRATAATTIDWDMAAFCEEDKTDKTFSFDNSSVSIYFHVFVADASKRNGHEQEDETDHWKDFMKWAESDGRKAVADAELKCKGKKYAVQEECEEDAKTALKNALIPGAAAAMKASHDEYDIPHGNIPARHSHEKSVGMKINLGGSEL